MKMIIEDQFFNSVSAVYENQLKGNLGWSDRTSSADQSSRLSLRSGLFAVVAPLNYPQAVI